MPDTWPANLDGKPVSLYEMIDSQFFERAVEQAYQSHEPHLLRHHALDDAKANRLAWLSTGGNIEKRMFMGNQSRLNVPS